jgi:hypothetical protein
MCLAATWAQHGHSSRRSRASTSTAKHVPDPAAAVRSRTSWAMDP